MQINRSLQLCFRVYSVFFFDQFATKSIQHNQNLKLPTDPLHKTLACLSELQCYGPRNITSMLFTSLTPLNLTKRYCRKCKNWSKSDYVINTGPMQVRNRWPGSVTGVAWHGCSRDWCARDPGINSEGNHHF